MSLRTSQVAQVLAPRKPTRLKDANVSVPSSRSLFNDSSVADVDSELFFLSPSQLKTDREKLHKDVFKMCKSAGLCPISIKLDRVLRVQENDGNFYVLHEFEGPAFEHLKKNKCKVISSFLVRECLRLERSLVKVNVPLYSLHLEGAKICCTGFSVEERAHLSDLIFAMGGTYSGFFSESCTHLVAEKYDSESKKYRVAAQLGRPVMDRSWIDEAWKLASSHIPRNCTAEEFVSQHKMALFKGTLITKTNVSQQQMIDMIRLIENYGGKYSGALSKQCTHMIVEGTSGQKYMKAREWGTVKLVDLKWLAKSTEAGYVLAEQRFDPERHRCSTPTAAGKGLEDLDISAIPGQHTGKISTQQDASMNTTNRTEGVRTPATDTRPATSRSRSSIVPNTIERSSTSLRRVESRFRLQDQSGAPPSTALINRKLRELEDPIDGVDDRLLTGLYDHLEGCRLFVVGAAPASELRWKRLLNCLGATRIGHISATTIVVVVRMRSTEDEQTIKKAEDLGAIVVTASWVISCLNDGEFVPTDGFKWSSLVEKVQSEMENEVPRASQSVCTTSAITGVSPGSRLVSHEITDSMPADEKCRTESSLRSSMAGGTQSVLRGVKFRIHSDGMTEEELGEWREEITQAGGEVVSDIGTAARFLVCPLVEFGNLPNCSTANVDDIVSPVWLYDCISQGVLLPPRTNPLYRPVPACQGSMIFKGCVLSFISVPTSMREPLSELITQFGGSVQNEICRRDMNGKRKSTHLVAAKDDSRCSCARDWGVQVVDASWVIECVVNDSKIPEEMFPMKGGLFESYEGRSDDIWNMAERGRESEMGTPSAASEPGNRRDEELVNMSVAEDVPEPVPMYPLSSSTPINPAVKRLRSQHALPGTPDTPDSPMQVDTPSKFLNPDVVYHPKFKLKGLTQLIDNQPSPSSQQNTSDDSLSVSAVGRILNQAVENTGKLALTTPKGHAFTTGSPALLPEDGQPGGISATPRTTRRRSKDICNLAQEEDTRQALARDVDVVPPLRKNKNPAPSEPVVGDKDKLRKELARQIQERLDRHEKVIKSDVSQTTTSSTATNGRKRNRSYVSDRNEPHAKRASKENAEGRPCTAPEPENEQPIIEWNTDATGSQPIALDNAFGDSVLEVTATGRTPVHVVRDRRSVTSVLTENVVKDEERAANKTGLVASSSRVSNAEPMRAPQPPPPSRLRQPAAHAPVYEKPAPGTSRVSETRGVARQLVQDARPASPVPTPKVFAFTSITDVDLLAQLKGIVVELGGVLTGADLLQLNHESTHLVSGRLVRNEKILCSLAKGLWILGIDYITDSAKCGQWLPESDYEWVKKFEQNAHGGEREKAIATCASWWRETLSSERAKRPGVKLGAFSGWRMVMYTKKTKSDSLCRVVSECGGEAMQRDEVEDLAAFSPTHVLVDKHTAWNHEELDLLASLGARIFKPDYISTMLTKMGKEEASDYHPDYIDWLREKKRI